ncbi:phenylalanyl-tRNA synthetase beta subunit [Tissierella praeacuta DSM 18095]|uniref:Phenylalanine--tRNA ligase beta subunit n=1 Tax=Tissierella praeacuta DSM 18095 TaxID=1123404 RepID=A0A1M4Z3H3_9FIRM|nr:phenylalanine--tRNA ligase subunit beta [Tissierella praeacuta]SHF12581.1 phenylalanyl-tRNA synthetase beta subunit [Tissierella praeacuta DSM 18095]SUP00637.1 Phenylalanine--tRNA ligase beta subunit [Tissierella praeacuta]
MLLPVKWLKDYIETEKDARILADGLTLSGSHVESIIALNKGIENVVVGKILNIEKHPDADKLLICKVSIGRETLQIVTGATNLNVEDYIPVAVVGAKLPGDITIEKTNFRGVDSYGMLCSLKELGYSDNVIPKEMKDGIFILDKEYPLGMSIVNIMGLDSEVIEFEITPNRPDCLSIIGMAREAAATFNIGLKESTITIKNEVEDIKDYLESIEVPSDNCNRYYAKVIKDVKIEPSPLWMQTRLMEAGVRPINNIVDITNFVMLEYGEPLHAFDLEKVEGRKIIVRQAKEGEKILTLDEVERNLKSSDLVIADDKKPIALAGVMGGFDTEITENTKYVLLEGANFNSKSVRLTSKRFGLRTEASTRFEKGIDSNLGQVAVDRVCQLVEEIGAGIVIKGNIDVYKKVKKENIITVRPTRVNKLLGTVIPVEDMIKYLNGLGFEAKEEEELITVKIPTFRLDIEREVDLIEEIGRLYGFHNIESKPLIGVLTRGEKPKARRIEDKAKTILQGLGLNEVMTYSFISPKAYDKINLPENSSLRNYIKLINPLGEDYSVMRTTLIPNMLELLSRNYNRGVPHCAVYEIGNTFTAKEFPIKELPQEKKILSLGVYGNKDFYYLKEVVDKTLDRLGIKDIEYIREENNLTFHPGRTAKLILNEEELGILGEIHVDVAENYDIQDRVYVAQLDFDKIVELTNLEIKYKPLPKYPSMLRDLALVVKEDILVGDIQKVISRHGEGLIEKIELFDIYTGNQIPEGMKSVAYSITYRSYDRTLRDDEVNNIQQAIIQDLENTFDAKLRS